MVRRENSLEVLYFQQILKKRGWKPLKRLQCKKLKGKLHSYPFYPDTLTRPLAHLYEGNIHTHFFGTVSECHSFFSLSCTEEAESNLRN